MADWLAGGVPKGFVTPASFPEALLRFTSYAPQCERGWVSHAPPDTRQAFPVSLGGTNALTPSCRAELDQLGGLLLAPAPPPDLKPVNVALK
eukprot:8569725-Pyramimonas_sp.AAC.1